MYTLANKNKTITETSLITFKTICELKSLKNVLVKKCPFNLFRDNYLAFYFRFWMSLNLMQRAAAGVPKRSRKFPPFQTLSSTSWSSPPAARSRSKASIGEVWTQNCRSPSPLTSSTAARGRRLRSGRFLALESSTTWTSSRSDLSESR
jgi:hypothetical protein